MRLLCAAWLVLPGLGAPVGVVFTTLHSFGVFPNGSYPSAVVRGSGGNFYGTTANGGTNGGGGTVFQITTNGDLTTLYSFTGTNDGAYPRAGLVQGADGSFYGTTQQGGDYVNPAFFDREGTVFRITTNGILTTIYSFTGFDDGGFPWAGLAQGNDGNFFGTTSSGGANQDQWGFGGTVFALSTSTTFYGGTSNLGTVFRMSASGDVATLHSFTGGNDGANPSALVQTDDGNLYGTTGGGTYNHGTVFKITTTRALTSLYSFTGGPDGGWPHALVEGGDGNLYGTTYHDGVYNGGTAFRISTNGSLTTLYSFSGDDGQYPWPGMVRASDGNLYGTTQGGGANGNGTVFQLRTNGILTNLYSFTGGKDGGTLFSGVVQARDGRFYGTTYYGGMGGAGTIFRLTIAPSFQAVSLTNGSFSMTWSTEAGGRYQLQYNSELSSTNWADLGNPITATGATLNATELITNVPRRFYRVLLLP